MSAPHKHQWDERVEKYAREFNSCRVVDLPSRVQKITQRDTMLDAVERMRHIFERRAAGRWYDAEWSVGARAAADRVRAGNGGGGESAG